MSLVLNPVTSKCWELKLFKFRSLNIKIRMIIWGFPGVLVVKNPSVSVGDMGLIPESRRYPGKGNGNPLQYSCLENPMGRRAWQATVHGITKESDRIYRLHNSYQW